MLPPEATSSPASSRSAVVLPEPDGPTSTMNSPSAISSESSSSAVTSPNRLLTSSKTTRPIAQPFTAPVSIPRRNSRWKTMNTTTIGIATITAAADTSAISVV